MPAPVIPPSDAHDVPDTQGKLPAALLMAGSCLPVLGAVLLAPVLPRMQEHFEGVAGSEALVPLVLTVPALSLALLAPFAGVVVDRLGRKRLLIVATVLYALLGTVPLWVDSLYGILASRVLVGVAEAAIMTACTTLIGDYYTGRVRDRYLALQTMCASASATVFFVLGGALGGAAGRRRSGCTESDCCSLPPWRAYCRHHWLHQRWRSSRTPPRRTTGPFRYAVWPAFAY